MRRSRPTVSVVLQRLSDAAFDALSAGLIARLTAAINRNTGRLIFLFGLATPLTAAAMQVMVETRSEEHTSELQSLMRISYAVFCLKKKNKTKHQTHNTSSEVSR